MARAPQGRGAGAAPVGGGGAATGRAALGSGHLEAKAASDCVWLPSLPACSSAARPTVTPVPTVSPPCRQMQSCCFTAATWSDAGPRVWLPCLPSLLPLQPAPVPTLPCCFTAATSKSCWTACLASRRCTSTRSLIKRRHLVGGGRVLRWRGDGRMCGCASGRGWSAGVAARREGGVGCWSGFVVAPRRVGWLCCGGGVGACAAVQLGGGGGLRMARLLSADSAAQPRASRNAAPATCSAQTHQLACLCTPVSDCRQGHRPGGLLQPADPRRDWQGRSSPPQLLC